ncbi:MAG: transposase [Chloroflexi bacterium]|nr:transposase [Chloroflexota bacterium]
MPQRGNVFAPGQYYHIYNRGAGKADIFFNPGNYEYLLRLVKRDMQPCSISVIAYCLMSNHYHFLLRQDGETPVSKFINMLFNAYVQAVNQQQNRSGTLFEGRYRMAIVDEWGQLIHLCRYIHYNPVKAGMVKSPQEWPYSNYAEWIGLRDGALKDDDFIHDHFSSADDYINFVMEYGNEVEENRKMGKYLFD